MDDLRERILTAFRRDLPQCARALNPGALEDELWTDESWRDEYAEALTAELQTMVADGLLESVDMGDEPNSAAFYLTKQGVKQSA